MACFNDLSGCDLIFLANAIAIALSQDMDANEVALWSSFFTIIGDNLAAIATSRAIYDDDIKNK